MAMKAGPPQGTYELKLMKCTCRSKLVGAVLLKTSVASSLCWSSVNIRLLYTDEEVCVKLFLAERAFRMFSIEVLAAFGIRLK